LEAAVTSARQIISAAGGNEAVIKRLGPEVSSWSLVTWQRNRAIPEEYHPILSEMSGVALEDFPSGWGGKARVYGSALAYRTMCHALKVSTRRAAKMHRMPVDRVMLWHTGKIEVPLQAFIDLYNYATLRRVDGSNLTVDEAMELTSLSQTKLCEAIGVSRANAYHWRKVGRIPEKHVAKIFDVVSGRKIK
jgi:hypothetical protein